jgi:hypothetical protein
MSEPTRVTWIDDTGRAWRVERDDTGRWSLFWYNPRERSWIIRASYFATRDAAVQAAASGPRAHHPSKGWR